jgi:beta-glucosidase
MKHALLVSSLHGAAVAAAHATPPSPPSAAAWQDPSAPIDSRVAALLAEMTQAEKVAQTVHLTSCDNTTWALSLYGAPVGACPLYGGGAAALAQRNALAASALNASRLGIPMSFHTESLHGACGGCVVFPMPAGQAATWDVDLVGAVAGVVALEGWATGIDRGFSPELNVPTDARFGRTEENFSEDPCLTGALGAAAVLGLHAGEAGGPSAYLPARGAIVSEAKHAAAYAHGGKDGAPADISERTLHDVYLRPWREYALAGGRGAMLAHNAINAVPCHSSADLMGWLREQVRRRTSARCCNAANAVDAG